MKHACLLALVAVLVGACGDDSSGTTTSDSSSAATSAGDGGGGTSSDAAGTTTDGSGAGATSSSSSPDASASSGAGGAAGLCATCGEPTTAGTVANGRISELSGLAASRLREDILYAHNDSGDDPRFFAMTLAGEDRGTFNVPTASAVDWEEMAAGPCADGAPGCLYIADFGDNDEVRSDLVLYRIHEPTTFDEDLETDVAAEAYSFAYPDGAHNAEAFVVHPTTGVVTIFTKGATSRIYELTPPLTADMTAVFVGEVSLDDAFIPLVTAADIDPEGGVVAIRTYSDVFLYPIGADQSAAQAVLAGGACSAPHGAEQQGEAIAFLDGSSFVTAPEGAGSIISRVDCAE